MAYDMMADLKSKNQQKLAEFQAERGGFIDENMYDSKVASFDEPKDVAPANDFLDVEQSKANPLETIQSSDEADYESSQGGLATPIDAAKGMESFAKNVIHNMPNATELEHTDLYETYFRNGTDRVEEHRRIANALGIDARVFAGDREAYIRAAKSAAEVEKYKKFKEFMNDDGSVNMQKIYDTVPGLAKIQKEKGTEAAALALGSMDGIKKINEIYHGELTRFMGSVKAGWERNNLTAEKSEIYAKAARELRRLNADEEAQVKEINNKLNQVAGFSYSSTGAVLGAMIGGVAENADMFKAQLYGTVAGGVVAGATAYSGIGAFGAGTAYKVTSNVVSTAVMANQIMGAQYEELINKTDAMGRPMYTPEQAASLAGVQGLSEAALEQWTFGQMGRAIMGKPAAVALKDIITKSALKQESELVAKASISSFIKDRLGEGLKAGIVSGSAELKEEFLQQASDMILEDVWQAYLKGDKAEIAGLEDILASSTANAIMAVPTVAGFGILGFTGNRVFNNKYAQAGMNKGLGLVGMHQTTLAEYENSKIARSQVENEHRFNIISNTNEAIANGALEDLQGANQDIAVDILDAKNEEADATYTYVDIKSLNQMEGGAELVNQIAEAAGLNQDEVQMARTIGDGMLQVKTSSLQLMQLDSNAKEKLKDNIASADGSETNNRIKEGVKRVRDAMARVRRFSQTGKVDEDIVAQAIKDNFGNELEQSMANDIYNNNMSLKAYRESLINELESDAEGIAPILEFMRDTAKQGVSYIENTERDDIGAVKRVSNNLEWYRNWAKDHPGKAWSDTEARYQAYEALMGNDTYQVGGFVGLNEVPAEELEASRNRAQELWSKLEKLDDKAFTDKIKTLTTEAIMATADLSPEARAEYINLVQQFKASTNKDVSRAAEVATIMRLFEADRLVNYYKDAGLDYSTKDALNALHINVNASLAEQDGMFQQQAEIDAVRQQYEGTAQWLKAPNGEDTNLTEQQWLQVRTPSFKKWFGDWENDAENASKVVDENGEPMVMYHGSDAEFDTFDETKTRNKMDIQGMFFSPWGEDANGYGGNLYACFLNMRKPAPESKGYKALNNFSRFRNAGEMARKFLQKLGFDGVNNSDEEFIVFNPNQIKSATGNIGTFDASNANIYYQEDVSNVSVSQEWGADSSNYQIYAHKEYSKVVDDGDAINNRPDHKAAKSGDINAAIRIVKRVKDGKLIHDLVEKYPNAIVAPIYAENEDVSTNKLPIALAHEFVSKGLKQANIVQIEKAKHTNADALDRIINVPQFDGDIVQGAEYIIIDDVMTMGGSLNALRSYIESKGGKVVAISVLANNSQDGIINLSPTQETLNELRKLKYRVYENILRKEGLYANFKCLTEQQARAIIGSRQIREAILKLSRKNSKTSQNDARRLGLSSQELGQDKSVNQLNTDTQGTMSIQDNVPFSLQEQQFNIIQSTNPMNDDFHTGIRKVEDIRTAEEVFNDEETMGMYADWTPKDGAKALKNNKVIVYSSYPIKNGTFVTPSKMNAQDYAGGGKVYSKTISLDKVAWIDGTEGMFADVEDAKTLDQSAWHGSPYKFDAFDLGKIGDGEGAQIHGWGLYFAKTKKIANSYKTRLSENISGFMTADIKLGGVTYTTDVNGSWINKKNSESIPPGAIKNALWALKDNDYNIEDAIYQLEDDLQYDNEEQAKEDREAIALLRKKVSVKEYEYKHKGSLYEVEVPENEMLLDENKSYSKQSNKVKEALKQFVPKGNKEALHQEILQKIYEKIGANETNAKAKEIAEYLADKVLNDFIVNPEEEYHGRAIDKQDATIKEKLQSFILDSIKNNETFVEQLQEINMNPEQYATESVSSTLDGIRLAIDKGGFQNSIGDSLDFEQMTGQQIYQTLSNLLGGPKEASLWLNEHGVKGISYNGGEDGKCFVVFDDKAVGVINRYNQQSAQAKGQLKYTGNAQEGYGNMMINLFENADESTFFHEMSHAYLLELERIAVLAPNSKAAEDLNVIKGWASWTKGQAEEYRGTSTEAEFYNLEQKILKAEKDGFITNEDGTTETLDSLKNRWMQERFARAFEEYLRSGEAPAPALKKPFRRLKQWLNRIYKVVTNGKIVREGAGARASAEVEAVMARMVASDEMIETMQAMNILDGTELDGNMSTEDVKAMHERWKEEAKEQAKERMLSKLLTAYKKEVKDKLDAFRKEREPAIREELQQEPCFAVDAAVEEGIPMETALEMFGYQGNVSFTAEQQYKQDKRKYNNATIDEAVNTKLDEESKNLKKQMPSTVQLQEQAIEALANEKQGELIALEAELLRRREIKYNEAGGKLGVAFEEVDKAITKGDVNALKRKIKELRYSQRWKEAELKYFAEMDKALLREDIAEGKEKLSKVKEMFDEFRKNTYQNLDWMRGVRDAATEVRRSVDIAVRNDIMNMPVRIAKSIASWNRKAGIAANEAVKNMTKGATLAKEGKMEESKKAYDEAHDNKVEQLYDAEMLRQSVKLNRKINSILNKVKNRKRALSKRKLPALNRYYYEHLMYLYGFQSTDATPPSELTNFNQFWAELTDGLEVDFEVDSNLIAILDGNEKQAGYTHLTMYQLNDLMALADVLYTTGINANRLLTMDVNIEDIAMEANGDWMNNVAVTVTNNKIQDIKGAMGGYMSSIVKPEVLLRLTGGKDGAFIKYIYNILWKATENEARAKEREAGEIKQIVDTFYTREQLKQFDKPIDGVTLSNGEELTKNNVLSMALNWGNKTNQARLIVGLDLSPNENVTRREIEAIFAKTLSRKDWEFVQSIWNHIGRYGDEVNKVVEKLNGVPMKRVEADSFKVTINEDGEDKVITIAGGYYPIVADTKHNADADEKAELEQKAGIMGGNAALGSGQGSTKNRSASMKIKRMLLLDLGVISKHINQQIHIANMRLACRDAYKVLNNQTVANAIQQTWGNQVYKDLKSWVVDIWTPSIGTGVAEHFIGKLRSNTISAIMSYRVSTALLNFANISPMIGKIGWANTIKAMTYYAGHFREVRSFVHNDSVWMRNRATNMDRDLSQVQADLFNPSNPIKHTVDKYSNWLIEQTDMICSVPLYHHVYMETYNKLIETMDEQEAREQAHMDAHEAVRSIFGSADTVDASKIQRSKNELDKMLTPFFSFANTMFNAVAEKYYSAKVSGQRTIKTQADGSTIETVSRGDLQKKYAEFLQKVFYHYIFMSAIETALRMGVDALTDGSGDDKEPEELIYGFLADWSENAVNSMAGGFYGINIATEAIIRKIKGDYASGRGGSMGVIGGTASRIEKAIDSAGKLLEGKQDVIDFGRNVTKVGTSYTGFSDTIVDAAWNTARFIADDFEYDDMDAWREYLAKSLFDRKLKAKK